MTHTFRLLAALLTAAMLASFGVGFWSFSLPAGSDLRAHVFFVHYFLCLLPVTIGILRFPNRIVKLRALRSEYRGVAEKAGVIRAVMEEVERIRRERGLNTNDEALVEEHNHR